MSAEEILKDLLQRLDDLKFELSKTIIGQNEIIERTLMTIFCNGHCLLIGVPGLAKTRLVSSIAEVLDLSFNRIQFTPDLMPSDITGTEMLNLQKEFVYHKGPIFANLVLADEINRTPPKTQSALLEAMQERSVTVSGQKMTLPEPFFVMATQNPIEQEGTYPLPEAQLDRFMMSLYVDYPSINEEIQIVTQTEEVKSSNLKKVLNASQIIDIQKTIKSIPVAENVVRYAVELVHRTRPANTENALAQKYVQWGAGPRASQFLIAAAKCHAVFRGKYAPDIEDVKAIAYPVLNHRLSLNYLAVNDQLSIADFIKEIL